MFFEHNTTSVIVIIAEIHAPRVVLVISQLRGYGKRLLDL